MSFLRLPLKKLSGLIFFLLAPLMLTAQVTTITVGTTPVQSSVKRFGINLGDNDFYDSGQMLKNLVFTNPSFEGEIYQSTIECGGNTYVTPNQPAGTANSCTDADIYAGFTGGFWNYASYTVISGAAVGRTGTVCSYAAGAYPGGGVFTFCDSGTAPAQGDYIVVKTTLPTNVGWPGGDWQTVVGNGILTAETNDLPPSTTGKQSALLTAPTANDSIGVNMFFDSTKNETFVQLNGTYQLTFKAKGVSGSEKLAILLNRANAGLTYINQTESLSSSWQTYTINFNASENGTDTGRVELSFSTVGADTAELDDVSLVQTNTNPANTTVFRDEVVNALQALHPGVIRLWDDQLGESLDNLLAGPQGRQRAGYTPFPGFDGTDVNFQTQSVEIGLTDFLQLCQTVGADPWIVVPSTFSTGEAYGLIDYLAGSGSTTYGAKRVAAGQTAPWTSVFHQIHLEFGNEEWNGGTFKGGAIELAPAYGQAATTIFASIKNNPNYVASSFDLIVNGQSANPGGNQYIQSQTLNNDSFSVAPYMMYTITSFGSNDQLFGTTFAEAEAFVGPTCAQGYPPPPCNNAAEGVNGGYITEEQSLVGKPIVTSEMNLSPSAGTITQAALNGFTSSVAGGIAVLDSMFQQLRAGVLTQNLYELPGWESSTAVSPYDSMYLWGAMVDMGVTNRPRPQYLALQLADNAIGGATTEVQTTQSGSNPTDPQYAYGLNTVTLQTFHLLQSFAFTGSSNGSSSLVVFNVSPDYAEQVNFAGAVPSGTTVAVQQLTSVNPTDNNEAASVVSTTSSSIPSFNPSTAITLPPFSMTSFTWGGTSTAPTISAVTATSVTPTSETITWTTDQASTSQVHYGTTTSYGSSSTLNSTLTTSHSVTLTGLTAGTAYDFDVVSANSSSQSTTSGNSTFTTSAVPPVISNVVATPVTPTSETITWSTDQASTSQVSFGTTTSYGFQSALNSTLTTTHSVTISTNLAAGTTYDFDVASTNAQNATGTSSNSTFTTQTAPPIISAVTATAVSPTSETITWTTDQASTSVVNFGGTTSYGSQMSSSTMLTSHSITLTGLTQNTTYQFDVVSVNAASQSTTSANSSFLTSTPAPAISAITVSSITTTGATITWTTDLASSSQVFYGPTTAYGSQSTLNNTLVTAHSVVLTGLTVGTTYDFEVASTNSPGGTSLSTNQTFSTLTNPPVISSVVATAVSPTSETITWTTDQNSSSVVNYGGSTAYGSTASGAGGVTSHTVTLNGLTGGTTYDFDVVSVNAASQSTTSANNSFLTSTPAPTISAITVSSITTTGATITWTTDLASSSQVYYGTSTAYGLQSTLNSTLVTAHSVVLTGLIAGTTYDFEVTSTNSPGGTSLSTNQTFATLTTPPFITNVVATAVSPTSETITWTTDQNSSSVVNYGGSIAYGSSASGAGGVMSHTVTITGLTLGTTYQFDVSSTNASNQTGTTGNFSFLTLTPAPTISAVTATAVTTTTATITWTTDLNSSSTVNYGPTTGYGSSATGAASTAHSVNLSGLTPGTQYNFDVVSTNSPGGTQTSGNFTFTTVNVAPTISAVNSTGVTANSATITWTTNEPSSSQVNYGTTMSYGSQSTLNSALVTSHSVTITGLASGTAYDFDVVSANSSSQSTTSGNSTFTTNAVPPVISAVTATAIGTTTATITWTTDQSSSSVVNYGPTISYGSNASGGTSVTAHSVNLTGLAPGTTYDYEVTSANAGNGSATSSGFTFATNPVPPTITNVLTTGTTSVSTTITWTTDQASTSQVFYGPTSSYGSSSTLNSSLVTTHTVTITGLTPGATYHFDVASTNTSTTLTGTSTDSTFATLGAPAISAIVSSPTSTTATITWTTDQASSSQVNYGTTTSYGSQSAFSSTLVTAHSVTINGLTPGTNYNFDVVSANGSSISSTSGNSTFTTTASPVISAVASSVTSVSATITWTTDQSSSSAVNYGTSTGYGSSGSGAGSVTSHSVTLTGLTPGTQYDFDLVSTNGSGGTTTSGNFTFTTTPPPTISAVTATGITTTGATITWTTDQNSSSSVNYGTTTGYGSTTSAAGSVMSHSVTLTGLTAGTTYDYDVTSVNGTTGSATSGNFSFVTTAVAPVISAVVVSGSTTTTATINWTTDQPSSSQVFFGTTTGYGSSSPLNSTLTTTHSVTITGLSPTTTYDFDVASTNSFSLTATSTNSSFVTPAGVPPQVGYVVAWGITNTSAVVTWSTDVSANTQLAYGTTMALGQLSTLQTTMAASHGVTLSNLIPGTQYYFQAMSTGANGATGSSAMMSFTTTGTAPAGPPVISNVSVGSITNTSATITWTTDQPSTTLVNFGTTTAYGSNSTLDSTMVTSHSVTLTGLTLGTTYDFDVVSANSGAMSASSTNSTFLTTSVVNTPPVITNVATTNLTSTSVTVTWTTDQPASSLVNYGTSLSYGSSSPQDATLVTAHSVTLTGLAASTAYDFDVVSSNAAAQPTTSPNATFNTPATTATPPSVGYVVAWGINNTSAVVTWSTDVSANTQLAYGTTTALGQLSTLQTAMAPSHGVTLAGLIPGTTYYYKAESTGANGATGYSTVMSFTTTGTAPVGPPVISNVLVSSITNTSATITWTTDQASSSQVNFGTTTGYGSNSTLDSTMVTSHSVTLTGLTLGTTYDFDVVSANAGSLSATSGNSSFLTTSVSFTPPVISNVTTTNITSTSVTVTWTTDQPSWSQVNYGTTMSYGSSSPQDTTLVTAHSVTLTGLAASTAYDFDVVSTNAASQSTTSPNGTFSTPATTATPPYVGYVAAWGINNTGAIVTWSTDVSASAQLAYGTTMAMGQMSTLQPALTASHGVTLSGLASGTTYYFQAQSTAANGATGYSAVMSFTTTGTQTTPPPVISNLTVSSITNTTATITWTTDEASSSQANYGVTTTYTLSSTLDPTLVTSHSVTLSGLTPGTLYDFDVMSTNSVSLSSTSSNNSFTTTGTAPGPVISNVSSSGVTSGTATITWTTDEASSSVVNFGTTTSYGSTTTQAPLVTTHSVTLTGLTPNTTYNFDVASANAASTTTTSTNFTFKTTSNTAPPPVISYLSYWGITATQATITWSTDELTNTAVAYGTTNALGQLSPVQTALTNSHGVTLTGLTPGTTYYFVAQSADSGGNTGYSTTYSFTTLAGAPTISGATATPAANNTATINWTTSAPTTSYVVYGLTTSYGYYSSMTSSTTTPHCTLSYVPSGTIHYQLISQDANGNQVVSPDMTFVEP
jgi:hypothetical protein